MVEIRARRRTIPTPPSRLPRSQASTQRLNCLFPKAKLAQLSTGPRSASQQAPTAHRLHANIPAGILLPLLSQAKDSPHQALLHPILRTFSVLRHSKPYPQPDLQPTHQIQRQSCTATSSTETIASKPHRIANAKQLATPNPLPRPQAPRPAPEDNLGTTPRTSRPRSPRLNSAATSSSRRQRKNHVRNNPLPPPNPATIIKPPARLAPAAHSPARLAPSTAPRDSSQQTLGTKMTLSSCRRRKQCNSTSLKAG